MYAQMLRVFKTIKYKIYINQHMNTDTKKLGSKAQTTYFSMFL